ncbi:hypothetical protein H4219_005291 [Mycoemilia scoparia]|uniref:Uncharacterized protein n=1 Tax=Mycoemilia scoparia TaxID=417184 RepID=A0A9W7ZY67_9FUNG|nr:hypothetical protein H4219_005291 [Mycoemilia scoparia]
MASTVASISESEKFQFELAFKKTSEVENTLEAALNSIYVPAWECLKDSGHPDTCLVLCSQDISALRSRQGTDLTKLREVHAAYIKYLTTYQKVGFGESIKAKVLYLNDNTKSLANHQHRALAATFTSGVDGDDDSAANSKWERYNRIMNVINALDTHRASAVAKFAEGTQSPVINNPDELSNLFYGTFIYCESVLDYISKEFGGIRT